MFCFSSSPKFHRRAIACVFTLCLGEISVASPDDFFEKKIRPILVEHCYKCHSTRSKRLKADLRLDSREGLVKGGDSGPSIVVGKPEESFLIKAIEYLDADLEMPPAGRLPDSVIADLRKWVEMGAPWPDTGAVQPRSPGATAYDWETFRREHWAFRPVQKPELPVVRDTRWPLRPIDHFVLARLEAQGLVPAPPADGPTIIRRVYLDVIGLPPTPLEVEAFVRDPRDDAYDRVVDRLLASPRYGERFARRWLDVARYSDGFGTGFDGRDRPSAYRYRDWVVDAFNRDLPYDEFVRRQIAGDLIGGSPSESRRDAALATGFLSLGPTYSSDGGDPESIAKARADTLEDRMDTTFRGFMALTVACARCHDHKFDPIPTAEYYSLAGVFQNTRQVDTPLVPSDVVKRYDRHRKAIRDLDGKINKEVRERKKAGGGKLSKEEEKAVAALRAELERLRKDAPPKYPFAHAVTDSGSKDMHVALRGDLRKRGPLVPRRFLTIVAGDDSPRWSEGSGRLDLARAIASDDNPLTARVIVNRVWAAYFGHGLVRTPSNFGVLGDKPTHPELLDWLASTFVEEGWSMKSLHRAILLSATYRMSSAFHEKHYEIDSDNRWLWRMSPRRLDVEAWRDSLLRVTGELSLEIGGAPTRQLLQSGRRTLYSVVSRNGDRFESDRFLRLFDFPAARITSARRVVSTVPQQYLFLLNSPFMVARAKALSGRLQSDVSDERARIEYVYRLLYSRAPTAAERAAGLDFLRSEGEGLPEWQQYAQVLLSAQEFMYIQ